MIRKIQSWRRYNLIFIKMTKLPLRLKEDQPTPQTQKIADTPTTQKMSKIPPK